MVDGAYASMATFGDNFANELEKRLELIERALGNEHGGDVSFYRYERLALADSLLSWDGGWRVLSYAEFQDFAADPSSERTLGPARALVRRLGGDQTDALLARTSAAVALVARHTGIDSPHEIAGQIEARVGSNAG